MSAHVRTGPVGGPVNTLPCLDGGGPGSVISAVDVSRATFESRGGVCGRWLSLLLVPGDRKAADDEDNSNEESKKSWTIDKPHV
ncbi:hypothetical protein QJS10_CPA16g01150 [Acorus calamus]|uniref:Uncharacterized protein n=1 Tax=Acorus calamus TaxID=4465 RepID=A0AAV9CXJ4_ACOCL|nr:hypothetical protein QJS10_CPA16g01150 [Acorus calamus]